VGSEPPVESGAGTGPCEVSRVESRRKGGVSRCAGEVLGLWTPRAPEEVLP